MSTETRDASADAKDYAATGEVICRVCGAHDHLITRHLKAVHPHMTIDAYRAEYPGAPVVSPKAAKKIQDMTASKAAGLKSSSRPIATVFGFPDKTKGVVSAATGQPIPVVVMEEVPAGFADFVPPRDPNYIFQIDLLKIVLMGIEANINVYLKGHAGTGKSTLVEQIGAFTNRAMLRVQHTVNTEESHILGQYIVKSGETVWNPGPLQVCMRHGIVYLADEYDRALPQVLSCYQPVLEGKALVTKEAPPEWRIVKPHPNFRIIATGNTNGAGDETGLYQSTALQDFANYERFGIMADVDWMPEAQEIAVVARQADVRKEHAELLVKFATEVRRAHAAGKVGSPISPRALIHAGKIGMRISDFGRALEFAFMARLNSVDATACREYAQRIFGSSVR